MKEMYSIVEGRDFALQGGKPGFTVKDKSGTRWVPIDTKTFDKAELDRLTKDYSRRRGTAQIEKDMQAHKDAKAKQDAARRSQAPETPSAPSTPSAKPEPSPTPGSSSFKWDPNKNIIAAKGGKLGIMDKGDPKSWRQPSEQEKGEIPISSTNAFRNSPAGQAFIKQRDASRGTSSASASTPEKIKGGLETYQKQIKSGDIKGAEATGRATWAAANPKLAAAAAERERTRGTSATTNPLMKDFKSNLPAPKPAATATAKPAPTATQTKTDTSVQRVQTVSQPAAKSIEAEVKKRNIPTFDTSKMTRSLGTLKQSYEYDACDIVLEYLLSTGQADTINEALYVMMEMDSNCIQSIIETVG